MKYTITFIRFVLSLRRLVWPIGLRPARLAVCSALLWPLTAVHANHVEDVCTRSDSGKTLSKPVHIPVTITIGRDVQVGEAFGPWFTHTITWTCKRTPIPDGKHSFKPPNDYFEVKTQFSPGHVVDKGSFLADPSFRVYGFGGYNIGLIVKITQAIEGDKEITIPITTLPSGIATTEFQDSYARQHHDISKFHLTVQFRLVKLQGVPMPKTAQILPLKVHFFSISRHPGAAPYWKHHAHYSNYLQTTLNSISASCTTPPVNVRLGDAHGGNLRNINDTGPTKAFNLRFENCPAYMGAVAYRFQSVPQQAIANGILPLDPALSTASGVGVQVLNSDDTPLAFNDTFIPLTAYDAFNPDPLYLVPMKARIIRTSGALQGGDVHAVMKMVVRYL